MLEKDLTSRHLVSLSLQTARTAGCNSIKLRCWFHLYFLIRGYGDFKTKVAMSMISFKMVVKEEDDLVMSVRG